MNLWHLFVLYYAWSLKVDRRWSKVGKIGSKQGRPGYSRGEVRKKNEVSEYEPGLERMVQAGDDVRTDVGVMRIVKKLGEGSYGSVFEAYWESAGRSVALKIEKPPAKSAFEKSKVVPRDYTRITHEFRMMELFNNTNGFPLVYTSSMRGKFKFYAMQKLGKSLSKLKKEAGGRLPTSTVIELGEQMLNRLEAIHRKGFLMYDIHLGNFLVKDKTVYAIDLGMAFPYIIKGRHISEGASFIPRSYKNYTFASKRDCRNRIVSRRDDLERFLYVLVRLNTGSLPWDVHEKDSDVKIHKERALPSEICHEEAQWLVPAFKYVESMKFDEEPNYEFFRLLFEAKRKQIS